MPPARAEAWTSTSPWSWQRLRTLISKAPERGASGVTHDVLEAAAGLTAVHGLQAYDTGLRAAAAAEGLRLLPA